MPSHCLEKNEIERINKSKRPSRTEKRLLLCTLGFGQSLFNRPFKVKPLLMMIGFRQWQSMCSPSHDPYIIANWGPAVPRFTNSSRHWVLNRAEIHKKNRLKIHWNWISRSSWKDWIGIHVYWIGKWSYRQLNNLSTVTNHWLYEIELSSIDSCIACFENSGRSFRKNPSRAVQTNQPDNMTANASVVIGLSIIQLRQRWRTTCRIFHRWGLGEVPRLS